MTLVIEILDFEKFSARQISFTPAPHRMIRLVEEAVTANLASADKYGVRIEIPYPSRNPVVMVELKQFHQVMNNLMSNATKFAVPGSIIEVFVEEGAGTSIKLSVTNRG